MERLISNKSLHHLREREGYCVRECYIPVQSLQKALNELDLKLFDVTCQNKVPRGSEKYNATRKISAHVICKTIE